MHHKDWNGRTALHHICATYSRLVPDFVLYRLMERLLSMGADANSQSFIRDRSEHGVPQSTPLLTLAWPRKYDKSVAPDIQTIKLLLDHMDARAINTRDERGCTFLHRIVAGRYLDLLQSMYTQLPHDSTSAMDYTLIADLQLGSSSRTLIGLTHAELQLLATERHTGTKNSKERAIAKATKILDLLKTEREKQYATIRSLLQRHTSLKLNDHTDFTAVVFSYIVAPDYGKSVLVRHRVTTMWMTR